MRVRRGRLALGASVVVSVMVLVAWFPASAILSQRQSAASTASQLQTLQQEDAQLKAEQQRLGSTSEIDRIAQEQYQLVNPGDRAYQVLPPSAPSSNGDPPYGGDPALQALAPPLSSDPQVPSASTTTTTTPPKHGQTVAPTTGSTATSSSGLLRRVLDTLEFWR
jgi:cell division protein FtsB